MIEAIRRVHHQNLGAYDDSGVVSKGAGGRAARRAHEAGGPEQHARAGRRRHLRRPKMPYITRDSSKALIRIKM